MLKHMTVSPHTRVIRGDQVPPTPPLTAKVIGIPTMEELSSSPSLCKRNDVTFTPSHLSHHISSQGETRKENVSRSNGHAMKISNGMVNREDRPVSVHGNLINNQSIYANTIMVPKMNGSSSTGKGLQLPNESRTPSKALHNETPAITTSSVGTNLNTSYNALLNNSRLSSSNSPSTNGTKTTGMDSSRDNPNDDFELSARVSPPTTTPNGRNVSLSRSSSHRQAQFENHGAHFPSMGLKSQPQHHNLTTFNTQHSTQKAFPNLNLSQISQKTTHNTLNTTKPAFMNNSNILSPGERSINYPHNSTIAPHSNICSSHVEKSHNQPSTASNSFFNASFIPRRNMNNQRVANMTAGRDQMGPTSGYGGKLKMMNSSLIPENVSKFMQMSKEVGVKDAITSLGLLCLVSLLLALLSLVFLLKLSPVTEEQRRELYGSTFLSATETVAVYEVTLGMCALALSLNLCCLLVSSIQFLLAVKLVKSSPIHGRSRTKKYLHEAAVTRTCAIGGFFVSIPVFLTGIILYTFLHFNSTPAILTSTVIGLAILFCGGAVVHNVFLWRKEIQNNRGNDSSNSSRDRRGEGDGEPALPMSPILKRVIDHNNRRNNYDKYMEKSYVDLPQATLDLSGGGGIYAGGLKTKNNMPHSVEAQHTSLERAALELSTLV